jgi:hypothetical protein
VALHVGQTPGERAPEIEGTLESTRNKGVDTPDESFDKLPSVSHLSS